MFKKKHLGLRKQLRRFTSRLTAPRNVYEEAAAAVKPMTKTIEELTGFFDDWRTYVCECDFDWKFVFLEQNLPRLRRSNWQF